MGWNSAADRKACSEPDLAGGSGAVPVPRLGGLPGHLGGAGVNDHPFLRDRRSSSPDRRAAAMRQQGFQPPSHQDAKDEIDGHCAPGSSRLGVLVTWWFIHPRRAACSASDRAGRTGRLGHRGGAGVEDQSFLCDRRGSPPGLGDAAAPPRSPASVQMACRSRRTGRPCLEPRAPSRVAASRRRWYTAPPLPAGPPACGSRVFSPWRGP